MRRSFSIASLMGTGTGQFKIRIAILLLALANAAALYFYLYPPGGSQRDLEARETQLNNQMAALKMRDAHVKSMATRVESGSKQIGDFERQYFLPKRLAYGGVIAEIQRMAKASNLEQRDAGFTEEPIEGTADLDLLTIKANYEGSYASLMRFLYEADHSPMLLMLDSMTAAPEQKNGEISTDIRFQAVIQDENPISAAPNAGARP